MGPPRAASWRGGPSARWPASVTSAVREGSMDSGLGAVGPWTLNSKSGAGGMGTVYGVRLGSLLSRSSPLPWPKTPPSEADSAAKSRSADASPAARSPNCSTSGQISIPGRGSQFDTCPAPHHARPSSNKGHSPARPATTKSPPPPPTARHRGVSRWNCASLAETSAERMEAWSGSATLRRFWPRSLPVRDLPDPRAGRWYTSAMNRRTRPVLIAICLLLLGACGSDESGGSDADKPATSAASNESTSEPAVAGRDVARAELCTPFFDVDLRD